MTGFPGDADWSAWPAPAKLNLFLRITGRRADGYHALQTVFRLLDWGDTVYLRSRADGLIRRVGAGAAGVAEADDLLVGSARACVQTAIDAEGEGHRLALEGERDVHDARLGDRGVGLDRRVDHAIG